MKELINCSSIKVISLLHLNNSNALSKKQNEAINMGIAPINERSNILKSNVAKSFSKFHKYLSLYSSSESSSKIFLLTLSSYLFLEFYLVVSSSVWSLLLLSSPSSSYEDEVVVYLCFFFYTFLPTASKIFVFFSITISLSSGILFTSISSKRIEF